jgi:hypothetical protein
VDAFGAESIKGIIMYNFSLYSADGDHKFTLEEENEVTASFYFQLLNIFSEIDYENKVIKLTCTHQMDQEIRNKIAQLVSVFEKANIQLRKFASNIYKIPDGQFFFVFPEVDFTIQQIMAIAESLKLLNSGINFDELDSGLKKPMDDFNSIFKEILENYELNVFDPQRKFTYGEKDKSKRKCKYCGKTTEDGATFSEEAHAISESLGNKTIFSADECDACNARFSNGIEKDVFEYLKVYRVLYGKSGKNGIPQLIFKNGIEIKYQDGKAIIIDKSEASAASEGNLYIPLEFHHEINWMNVYRGFVKFAVAVLPRDITDKLSKTINWINNEKNDGSILNLPPVASMIDYSNFHDQPKMTIYTRTSEDLTLPYLYVELRIAFFIFVFIVPYCDNDKTDFAIKENYDLFWTFNKHYNHLKIWNYYYFTCDEKKPFIMSLNINSDT